MNINTNYPLLNVSTVVPVKTTKMTYKPTVRTSAAAVAKAKTIFTQTAALAKLKAR